MKKRLLAALMASSLMLSLAACGGSDTNTSAQGETGTEAQDGPYQISMVLKTNAAEFWQVIQAGAEAYQEEHPDLVSLDIKGPPGETFYEEQLNMIQTDLALESYDGYLIAPLQSDAVATAIASTDKPVVAFDTDIDSDKCLSFVGTGNEEAAKQGAIAAVAAAEEAGWETIQCIEIAGVQGDETNTARMNGYMAGIEEAGGDFLEDEVQYANATADNAVTCMEAIMQTHPAGIAIICANNDDMAMAAARAAAGNEAYADTIFLGFNGDRAACDAILAGELTMSVAQMAYEMGYKAVETMVQALNGEEVEPFVDSGSEVISIDNAEERLATLDEQLGA